MRNKGGWVKMYRKIFDEYTSEGWKNDLYGDFGIIGLLAYLISHANFNDGKSTPKGWSEPLKKGQILTSIQRLAQIGGMSERRIRIRVDKLQRNGTITVKGNGRLGTVITICNYEKYQSTVDNDVQEGEVIQEFDGIADGSSTPHYHKKKRHKENNINTSYLSQKHTEDHKYEQKEIIKDEPKNKPKRKAKPKTEGSLLWAYYESRYEAKYGFRPTRSAKGYSATKKISEAVSVEDRPLLVDVFLESRDRFISEKAHPIELLLSNIDRFRVDLQRKKPVKENKNTSSNDHLNEDNFYS